MSRRIDDQEREDAPQQSQAGKAATPLAPQHAGIIAMQQSHGNAAVSAMLARSAGGPVAEPEKPQILSRAPSNVATGTLQKHPDDIAQEIYDSLDGWDDEERCIRALMGHDQGQRAAIKAAFERKFNQTILSYVKEDLSGDDLVRAAALLHSSNTHEPHTQLALALIPAGTRDNELWRVWNSGTVASRKEIERRYNQAFGEIGKGSLKDDLTSDLSGADKEKAVALLERELTKADELYFASVGVTGTKTDDVVKLIQDEWKKGPEAFTALEADWNNKVKAAGWTSMSLQDAMRDELSGEALELVEAVFAGAQKLTELGGAMSTLDGKPVDAKTTTGFRPDEEARLTTARRTIEAATTGGYTGAGTNEAQLFEAADTIRTIWEARIERVEKLNDARALEDVKKQWETERAGLKTTVDEETSGADFKEASLTLAGSLTTADKLWLAGRRGDNDLAVTTIDEAWSKGEIAKLDEDAAKERKDTDGTVLRPVFNPNFINGVISGYPAMRVMTLLNRDKDFAEQGARRLHVEIYEDNDDAQLGAAKSFLELLKDDKTKLDSVLAKYAEMYLKERTEATPDKQFVAHVFERFERSHNCFEIQNLLDPPKTAAEMAKRAREQEAAAHDGFFSIAVDAGTAIYDTFSAEDSQESVDESMNRLDWIAEHAEDGELDAMAIMLGIPKEEIAKFEFDQFKARLEDLRAVRATIAESIATAVEIIVDVAITILSGGAAAPLLVSLASSIAGMLAREAMLGSNYELLSEDNMKSLASAVAGEAMGAMGGEFLKDVVTPEKLEQLGKVGKFMEKVSEEAGTALGEALTEAAFAKKMPTAEEFGVAALNQLASIGLKGVNEVRGFGLPDTLPLAQKLRNSVIDGLVEDVGGGAVENLLTAVTGGFGDQTGPEILQGLAGDVLSSIGGSVKGTLAEHAGESVKESREATAAEEERRRLASASGSAQPPAAPGSTP